MATAVADTYSAASGATLYAGRVPPALDIGPAVIDGDSMEAFEYRNGGLRFGLALSRTPPRVVANLAHPNDTLDDFIARQSATIGAASAAGAQCVILRGGTNGEGSGTFAARYASWVDAFIGAGLKVLCMQMAPKASAGTTFAANNATIASICAARPGQAYYLADCINLADGSYEPLAGMLADGIHFAAKGGYTAGLVGAGLLEHYFTTDPRITDFGDTYELLGSGSTQYVRNPGMSGGTIGGALPTHWTVSSSGGATHAAITVAADGADPVQEPWVQIEPLSASSGDQTTVLDIALQHPALSSDTSAGCKRLDCVIDVEFVSLNCTALKELIFTPVASSVALNSLYRLGLNAIGTSISQRLVMRTAYERTATAQSANAVSLQLQLVSETAFSGSVGYIKARLASARALAA